MNSNRIAPPQTRRGVRAAAVVLCAGLGLALSGLGGCATQQQVDQANDTVRSLKDRNEVLSREKAELERENQLLQNQRAANDAALDEMKRVNTQLRQQLQAAGMSLDDFNTRLAGLQFGSLDPETDRALTALAAKYPDIIRYDSTRGMLRFASDLTFASGSDQVQEAARISLKSLSEILNSAAATPYEVMIIGHTDAQKISSGTAARHPTNMHLSAHRAISVRSALTQMGVPAERMYAAGWGEHRPVVPHAAPSGNTPQNRRVEIFLTRGPGNVAQSNTSSVQTATPDFDSRPSRQQDMTK